MQGVFLGLILKGPHPKGFFSHHFPFEVGGQNYQIEVSFADWRARASPGLDLRDKKHKF